MKHRVDYRKLGRTTSHRKAMLDNMATSLFRFERIQTTLPKAKELRRKAEKLITLAKKDTLHARRLVNRSIRDKTIVKKLFDEITPRFTDRQGGYTRIIKLDFRMADAAPTAVIELVGSEQLRKKTDKKKAARRVEKEAKKPAKVEKVVKEEEAVGAEQSATTPSSDAPFKKAKARADAREAFMDRTAEEEEKSERKRKLFDLWRKRKTEGEPRTAKKEKPPVADTSKAKTKQEIEEKPKTPDSTDAKTADSEASSDMKDESKKE